MQLTDTSCGTAALAYGLKRLGITISEEELIEALQPGENGVTILGLAKAAKEMGAEPKLLQASYGYLRQVTNASVIHLQGLDHFVAVLRATPTHVDAFDPSAGIVRFPMPIFVLLWDGILLELDLPKQASHVTIP